MQSVEPQTPSPDFAGCWNAAGAHLDSCGHAHDLRWIKSRLEPPFLEHVSFSIGNQLFFVHIEDAHEQIQVPGKPEGQASVAESCGGHACIMHMTRTQDGWRPTRDGWSLIDAKSDSPIDPPSLATEEPIEMSDWELHDFAVQAVRASIESDGQTIMSSQGNPAVDPSVWFVGDDGPEWVVVRAVRYPERDAERPEHLADVATRCASTIQTGHFASVAVASTNQVLEDDAPVAPLVRRGPMYVNYQELEDVEL
jgi:hypothetical protein